MHDTRPAAAGTPADRAGSEAGSVALGAVIFGGSASGLWILNRLVRAGHSALLIEADRLGQGQTAACQGIIHGGLKYTLDGRLSASAKAIRSMPSVWRQCLAGERAPALTDGVLRAPYCHLWHSGRVLGRLGLVGARRGLRVTPVPLRHEDRPPALADVRGEVCRLDEQVVSPRRLIANLARPLANRLLRVEPDAVGIERRADGDVEIVLDPDRSAAAGALPLVIEARVVVLAAGTGNAALRARFGLSTDLMQVRSVQMLLARGDLPVLNGHCIEGAAALVTITSDRDAAGRTVWQIGGGVSEDHIDLDSGAFIRRGRRIVEAALGGRSLAGTEWAAYRADKAEVTTAGGHRPADAFARIDGRVITAWPTKLALVPRLAERVLALAAPLLPEPRGERPRASLLERQRRGWPAPALAPPPWEREVPWTAAA
ncbi:MAG: FAD-dependent oxidoreductase [Thiohalocapsa sp.]|nr:FAD-dependent oxidoreductase [Thiohalocapsa sp.]